MPDLVKTRRAPHYAEEPYSLLAEMRTAFDGVQALRTVCRSHGYLYFSVIALPSSLRVEEFSLARASTVSSLPPDLIAESDQALRDEGLSPFVRLRGRVAPQVFRIERDATDPQERLFLKFGIGGGSHFPVHDARGNLLVVSFYGDRTAPAATELAELTLFAHLLVERLIAIAAASEAPSRALLTARETEVLRWTAEGKTSGEIAVITGLSEHTVNHYVTLATQKLGCANRTQAVVQAIRQGLFN